MHCIILCDIPVILSEKLAYTSYYGKVLTLIGHIIETMVATGFQLGMDIFLNIPTYILISSCYPHFLCGCGGQSQQDATTETVY